MRVVRYLNRKGTAKPLLYINLGLTAFMVGLSATTHLMH